MTEPLDISPKKLAAIDSLFEQLPDDYSQAADQIRLIHQAFQERLARTLELRLKEYLAGWQQQPHTLDEYQQNASDINAITSKLGLCSQIDGKPAFLIGEPAVRGHTVSRFALMVADGRTQARSASTFGEAMHFELVPATPESTEALDRLKRKLEPDFGR
jgi:hypothetical protein